MLKDFLGKFDGCLQLDSSNCLFDAPMTSSISFVGSVEGKIKSLQFYRG